MEEVAAPKSGKRILVIKHGALGDFILASGPMKAIRNFHSNDHITLLTTPPYVDLGKRIGLFDDIWVDQRLPWWRWRENWEFIKKLRAGGFSRVYDLQTSKRSETYFRMMGRVKPEWNGHVTWCSHPHKNPARIFMHTVDRQAEQLLIAGIQRVPLPSVEWLTSDISRFKLPEKYVLVCAGGSAHRPEKRWHTDGFREVCEALYKKHQIVPVLLGTNSEKWAIKDLENWLQDRQPVINLTDQTSFADIAELARGAAIAIGNDTGPMHVIAAALCKTFVLFSAASDPRLTAPVGDHVFKFRAQDLRTLEGREIVPYVEELLTLDIPANVIP